MRVIQHHVRVPGKTWLFLNKECVYVASFFFLFFQGNGERNVGRAETNTDQIMNLHGYPQTKMRKVMGLRYRAEPTIVRQRSVPATTC